MAFHVWLDPLELAARQGDRLYVRAPDHIRSWVRDRYLTALETAAARALDRPRVVVELVSEDWAGPRPEVEAAPAVGVDAGKTRDLNPKYTFDQFVICDGNRLAHGAALAVAELPAQAYSPLFIHGPPGLGKTHLLHAIGNYVRRYAPDLTVRNATVEVFTTEFVGALRGGGTAAFKERFRGADVLLVDDIQFLAGREKTKEEFFHTLNHLHEVGAQIVLTSDRDPADLADIERRLRERFASGLVLEVEPPDFDARVAILRKRAAHDGLAGIGEDTLAEIARSGLDSVRALEGALIRVVAFASLKGEVVSGSLARTVLRRLAPRPKQCSLPAIRDAAAQELGVDPAALIARDRTPVVAFARQVAMYLARELTDEPLPAIGRDFGGRNHTTVLHAHRKIAHNVGHDPDTARAVDGVKRRLRST